jgi:hypothetical protein
MGLSMALSFSFLWVLLLSFLIIIMGRALILLVKRPISVEMS